MNWEEELIKLFDMPAFDGVKAPSKRITSSDRLIQSFEEINEFYDHHNRLPQANGDMNEKMLEKRLGGILMDISKRERCLSFDRHHILKSEEANIDADLDALFNNPIFATGQDDSSLFDVPEHLIKKTDKATPDFVAQRTKCEDFAEFESGFARVHQELRSGTRTIIHFQESHLKEGTYFLLDGVLVLLQKIYDTHKKRDWKVDGRTRCIFENGTESNILLRSLGKALYSEGSTIRESSLNSEAYLKKQFNIAQTDVCTGHIYVLRSKSDDSRISQLKDLYKIGFTTTPVEDRVANAKNETTFLMADVDIVASWGAYNLNVAYFENMLHKLFDQVRLQLKVYDTSGAVYVPREWFIVPLPIIKNAIENIINGIPISYNLKEQALEEHQPKKVVSDVDTSSMKILTLNIKDVYFDEILKGYKTKEYRRVKPTTINKYTYIDPKDGKRWLKPYDAIRFYVGYHRDRDSALVEVIGSEFDRDSQMIIYSLGQIIETRLIPLK